jgi:hypothetical protein
MQLDLIAGCYPRRAGILPANCENYAIGLTNDRVERVSTIVYRRRYRGAITPMRYRSP